MIGLANILSQVHDKWPSRRRDAVSPISVTTAGCDNAVSEHLLQHTITISQSTAPYHRLPNSYCAAVPPTYLFTPAISHTTNSTSASYNDSAAHALSASLPRSIRPAPPKCSPCLSTRALRLPNNNRRPEIRPQVVSGRTHRLTRARHPSDEVQGHRDVQPM